MFILFISLFYCRVGPTTIREISAVFTGFPKIRHLQKYGSEARGCDCYF
ncbi:unnamed protein product [Callosobruchus maculatus]|nr:unnamed protein product [Callosobruchus maculatus]